MLVASARRDAGKGLDMDADRTRVALSKGPVEGAVERVMMEAKFNAALRDHFATVPLIGEVAVTAIVAVVTVVLGNSPVFGAESGGEP